MTEMKTLETTIRKWLMDKMQFSLNEQQLKSLCRQISNDHPLRLYGVVKSLKDKEAPTLKDAFIAGYKKRALMSGLKYDEVSELNAITNFKCWKSFDLNL